MKDSTSLSITDCLTSGASESGASGCAGEASASSWTSVACSKQHGDLRCPAMHTSSNLAAHTEQRKGREMHSQKQRSLMQKGNGSRALEKCC